MIKAVIIIINFLSIKYIEVFNIINRLFLDHTQFAMPLSILSLASFENNCLSLLFFAFILDVVHQRIIC